MLIKILGNFSKIRILHISCFLLALATLWAGSVSADAKEDTIRIAIASFPMETCTFCPRPTDIRHFEHYGPPRQGTEVLELEEGGVPGFVAAAKEYNGVELAGAYAVRWPVGGTSGGWVTRQAYEKYADAIVSSLADIKDLDGIFLPLHGGMAVTGIERPEAELVRRIKKKLGDIPVAIVMDLHGNEDAALADVADIILAVKRFPHYDFNLMGERAARLLIRTIQGTYKPTRAVRKPGMIFATVFGGTGDGIAQDVMERARRWENRVPDAYVSVFWGFSYADVPDAGVAVFVVTNDDQKIAETIADDMNNFIWLHRTEFEHDIQKVKEGVSYARSSVAKNVRPFVIADMSDRMGDGTHILTELLDRDAENFVVATITDPSLIKKIHDNHKVGDTLNVDIGGLWPISGKPVKAKATVGYIGSFPINDTTPSPIASINIGLDRWIILTPAYYQAKTDVIIGHVGLKTEDFDIVAVKSRRHYMRGFIETGLAKGSVIIDAPGHGPANIGTLPYRNLPSGMYSKFFKE